MPIEVFNQLHIDVVNYLIAVYEGKKPPENLRDYMRAFEGGFELGMKFTLYTPAVNKLVMYVYEKNCDDGGIPRYEFTRRCKGIVKTLVEIAGFIAWLHEQGYVNGEYVGNKTRQLPDGYRRCWRRFGEFYASESDAILFVRGLEITPTEKLYALRNMVQAMS
jgi:hypothetical protein